MPHIASQLARFTSIYVPGIYTLKTRINGMRGLVGYLAWEFICPFLFVVYLSSPEVIEFTLLFFGFISLYECGYLINDRAETNSESGRSNVEVTVVSMFLFMLIRVLMVIAISFILYNLRNLEFVVIFLVSVLLVTGLLFIHSSPVLYERKLLRLGTFSGLAMYKYAPLLFPFMGVVAGFNVLLAYFLCYGVSRSLIYAFRKLGDKHAGEKMVGSQVYIQGGMLLLLLPLVWSQCFLADASCKGESFFVVWLISFITWLIFLVVRTLRRKKYGHYLP